MYILRREFQPFLRFNLVDVLDVRFDRRGERWVKPLEELSSALEI